ncbi:hypothetical protein B0O99DRAFT_639904 [Bisporella sp. PMI_857]|nr:hypothetical protein B0O99DRAFT_639904 [Bisporella sp. PMI_857]
MTTGDYLSRFKETRPQDWDEYATRTKMDFSTSVDEMFESSYQEVKAKDSDALDLLILCSFLAAENIPGVVLEVGSNRSGLRVNDMVDTLLNNGFGHREENLQSFRMHSLVQSWIRQHLSPEKQEALVSRALTTLATVVESERSRDVKALQGLEKLLLGHIIACLSRVENITHCDVSWCVLGNICKQQKRYIEAVILYQNGLSDPDIAKKRDCAQRQHLGYELGLLYQLQGRHNDAVAKYEEILEECNRDPPGKDNLHLRGQLLLDIYKGLSSVNTQIGGMAQSGKILMEGVSKLEKLFGSNSFQALQLLDISAAEFYDQEDYAQAEELFKWIVSAQIQTLGVVHPGTIHAQEKLARVYFQRGKFEDAEMLCQQYLSGLEKFLDAQHPATLQQVLFLGRICTKLHKFSEAEANFYRAVKGYEVLGLQHPETLNAREELAICFEAQEKLKEAHVVYMQVMFGREDGKDPRIRETLRRLLPLMERMGMKGEARQLMVQWSNGFRE